MAKVTMDMNQNFKSIFLYNKKNELTTYVDLFTDGRLKNYYNLSDNVLTRINVDIFKEKKKFIQDIKRAKIVFLEESKLFHMFLDGETFCKAVRKNSRTLESPKSESKIYSNGEEGFEGYTVKHSLINNWLEKL